MKGQIGDIMNKYELVRQAIESEKARSAWSKGVKEYALELVEHCKENDIEINKENMLNGARDWKEYSYGGSALIYDYDIAQRLCSASELKRNKEGERNPNAMETWLDCQARALYQACNMVMRLNRKVVV